MAPSDFPNILIDGADRALSDDHPLLTPAYKSCTVCYTSTWRRCSKCGNVWYCSMEHENAHWGIHGRFCSSTGAVEYPIAQKGAIVKPLKCYDLGAMERVPKVTGYYFCPRRNHVQLVDIKYRPGGSWFGDQLMGPCPVLGKYFPDTIPRCIVLESDSHRDFIEPLAIWYSERSIKERKSANDAIVSLFSRSERPKRSWTGTVVVMKFASWNYHNFVPVTTDDLVPLKLYFSNYVGLELIQ